jgi:uncharacterized membrane protein required for colicin V production
MDALTKYISLISDSVGLFDVVALLVLVLGYRLGIQRGGNHMLPRFIKWLAVLVAASRGYEFLGLLAHQHLRIDEGLAFIGAYFLIGAAVFSAMSLFESKLEQHIKDSAVFSEIETVGGGVLGIFTFALIMVFSLSLLHGNRTSRSEAARINRQNQSEYGEAALPGIASIKYHIFDGTGTGRFLARQFGDLLVKDGFRSVRARGAGEPAPSVSGPMP